MTPLELLESQRNKWIKAKRKSSESFFAEQISFETHDTHMKNLDPLIKEWSEAVELFQKALSEIKQ